METRHTPAPWVVKGNRIETPDGETVAYLTDHETLTPRQQRHATLISVAPETYDIVRSVATLERHRMPDGRPCCCTICQLAREAQAVISKSERNRP